MTQQPFSLTFWGVRGSTACPGADFIRYGGNTSCLEVQCGDTTLILDAGTGLRELGDKLRKQSAQKQYHLLLSHTHYDHICGFPFFSPAFDKTASIHIYAGHLLPDSTLKDDLRQVMSAPFFPIKPETLQAQLHYHDFIPGTVLTPATDITIQTLAIPHPDRATAYRINYQGKSLCYVTDIEHQQGMLNRALLAFIENCDLFIYDSTFTDEEYQHRMGWGHSTWQEGVRLAQAANVRKLALFHHDPNKTDNALAAVEKQAQALFPECFAAVEKSTVHLV